MPRVSVIMPVFNGEEYLREAIDSVLQQTFADLELIIISEKGTSAASLKIIESYHDSRIVHLMNEGRLGLAQSLNRGADAARGEYLARMDADDISLKNRLQRQMDYLEENPEVGILGAAIILVDAQGKCLGRTRYPRSTAATALESFIHNPLAHPSVMMRKDIFLSLGGYDPTAINMEDYDLWLRALNITRICSLKSPLLFYRWHGSNVSSAKAKQQEEMADIAAQRAAGLSSEEQVSLEILRNRSRVSNPGEAIRAARLLADMRRRELERERSIGDVAETGTFCCRIWISLALRYRGQRESIAVLGIMAINMGPTLIMTVPLAVVQLFSYDQLQKSLSAISEAEASHRK